MKKFCIYGSALIIGVIVLGFSINYWGYSDSSKVSTSENIKPSDEEEITNKETRRNNLLSILKTTLKVVNQSF
ncbi:hypothetical protein [Halobacillus mangrovi]|uniref:Uncharacterized protein n=1 Tax=Halobacillus mangrovi TaxID=402384 RepID=A0A1W5ZQF0_9BACI|nr:hypothetical protein [Halobacillus mangrovi]ARI75507.1 hypothetical protein HM131_01100 [Halobacillus mangrovi]